MPSYTASEWVPATVEDGAESDNLWKCRICMNNVLYQAKKRTQHEGTEIHKESRRFIAANNVNPLPSLETQAQTAAQALLRIVNAAPHAPIPLPLTSNIESPPPFYHHMNHPIEEEYYPPQFEDLDPFPVTPADNSLILAPTPDEQELQSISQSLQRLLEEGFALDDSSEDETVERSDVEDGADVMDTPTAADGMQGMVGTGAPRPRNYTADEADRREWFPWQDKLSCSLDLLAHLPRSVFSEKQLDLLFWLLQINGVNHVPSVFVMKEDQKALQEMVGIEDREPTYK